MTKSEAAESLARRLVAEVERQARFQAKPMGDAWRYRSPARRVVGRG